MSDRSFINGSSMSVLLIGEVGIVSSGANFLSSFLASWTKLLRLSQFFVYPASLLFMGLSGIH